MAAVQAFRRSYYLVARGNNRNNGTSLGAVTLNANNALGNSNGNNWRSRLHIAPRAIYFLLNFCPRRKTAAWTAPEPETPHRAAGRARKRMRGERRPMRGGSAERPRFLARPQVDRWLEGIGCHAKHDWQIFRPADRGVNICGFTVYPDHVELYRRIWHRIMRNIDAIKTAWQLKDYLSLMSRKGWLMAANKLYTPSLQIEQGEYLWR